MHTNTHLVYAHVRYIFPLRRRSTVWLPVGEAAGRWSSEHGSARNHLSIRRTIQVQSDMQLMFGCRSSNLARVGQCRNHHSRRTQMLRRSGVGAVSIARLVTTSIFPLQSGMHLTIDSTSSNLARVQSARESQMLNKEMHALFRRTNLRAELIGCQQARHVISNSGQ